MTILNVIDMIIRSSATPLLAPSETILKCNDNRLNITMHAGQNNLPALTNVGEVPIG